LFNFLMALASSYRRRRFDNINLIMKK